MDIWGAFVCSLCTALCLVEANMLVGVVLAVYLSIAIEVDVSIGCELGLSLVALGGFDLPKASEPKGSEH